MKKLLFLLIFTTLKLNAEITSFVMLESSRPFTGRPSFLNNVAIGTTDIPTDRLVVSGVAKASTFTATQALCIAGNCKTNWDVESDPIFLASLAYLINISSINHWNNSFGWGNHSTVGYLTIESDPIFSTSTAKLINISSITHWNNSYDWGNHSIVGYLTVENDPIFSSSTAVLINTSSITHWNNSYEWNNHSLFNYFVPSSGTLNMGEYSIESSSGANFAKDINLGGLFTISTTPITLGSIVIKSTDSANWKCGPDTQGIWICNTP
jgi:hypothetical protein